MGIVTANEGQGKTMSGDHLLAGVKRSPSNNYKLPPIRYLLLQGGIASTWPDLIWEGSLMEGLADMMSRQRVRLP